MLFDSLHFLVFLPVALAVYYIMPRRVKYLWLLICSYYYYMCWNAKYILLLLFSTVVTYLSGLALERIKTDSHMVEDRRQRLRKICVIICVLLNLSVLFCFKYFEFAWQNIEYLASLLGIKAMSRPWRNIFLPAGISFYTFQVIGYIVDVYRGDICAERNFLRFALFVSFFPKLAAGPIERSKNLMVRLSKAPRISYKMFRRGLLVMLWGYFMKIVIADRISIFTNTVYGDPDRFPGVFLAAASILFAVQIYCDFAGYSAIAIGTSMLFGIRLMENFDAPFMTGSVSEFWRHWHISLSSWFRDYVYIPLGGNRKGKVRKYLNLLITFGLSGLWHGAQWTYVVWGLVNGLFQIIGDLLRPVRAGIRVRIEGGAKEDKVSLATGIFCALATFLLFSFSLIFFKADSLSSAVRIIKSIFSARNWWILFDGSIYKCGLDQKDFGLMSFSVLILTAADLCKRKGISVSRVIEAQPFWFRWICYITSVIFILVFGIWGSGYDPAGFIYFQF